MLVDTAPAECAVLPVTPQALKDASILLSFVRRGQRGWLSAAALDCCKCTSAPPAYELNQLPVAAGSC